MRTKINALKVEMQQSGVNGTRPLRTLDTSEERVLTIMGVSSVEGDQENPEIGVTTPYKVHSAPLKKMNTVAIVST